MGGDAQLESLVQLTPKHWGQQATKMTHLFYFLWSSGFKKRFA
ncbi:hypothetical protein EV201_0968 [Ancylomarina subtilis]|uniref:Uncharacterized protein n=1 Tax=Ancylomarina subtilis TaxID=1639035 RepID=A0A4Q7VJF8_9BACT|nr:hypothetical protein EV201_0968 [Ancylomarina subtilis]